VRKTNAESGVDRVSADVHRLSWAGGGAETWGVRQSDRRRQGIDRAYDTDSYGKGGFTHMR
jgi:hypothetical protein